MTTEVQGEKIPLTPAQSPAQPAAKSGYKPNSSVQRLHVALLVLLSIQLVLVIIYFVHRIVLLAQYFQLPALLRSASGTGQFIGSAVVGLISLIYLIIFIVLTAKYSRVGILVFAWLSIIVFILMIIVMVLAIVVVVVTATHRLPEGFGIGLASSIISLVVTILSCILVLVVIIVAFKLASAIKAQNTYESLN